MLKKLKQLNKGFTIIEVLIVLAIAGLIMLIVFLAVPALQRSQRNSARKGDANRVAAAVVDFVSNNNGTLPGYLNGTYTAARGTTSANTIFTSLGTLGQYTLDNRSGKASGTGIVAGDSTDSLIVSDGAIASPAIETSRINSVLIVSEAVCSGNNATVAGTSRNIALIYTIETSSSTVAQPFCMSVQ